MRRRVPAPSIGAGRAPGRTGKVPGRRRRAPRRTGRAPGRRRSEPQLQGRVLRKTEKAPPRTGTAPPRMGRAPGRLSAPRPGTGEHCARGASCPPPPTATRVASAEQGNAHPSAADAEPRGGLATAPQNRPRAPHAPKTPGCCSPG
ncbi:hypothetical protein NN561_020203 [Cricetulus griseus]